MLQLDHSSLNVSELAAAQSCLERQLGFRLSVTRTAPRSHGRIFLDRGYIEVAASAELPRGLPRAASLLSWGGYFFRVEAIEAFVEAASERGVEVSAPSVYTGHDGEWLDVLIGHPTWRDLFPIIVQRISPPEIAADWPPPLRDEHPNGARTLASVYLMTETRNEAEGLLEGLSRLMGLNARASVWRANAFLQATESSIDLPGSRKVLIGTPSAEGKARAWLRRNGPGLFSVAFGTPDLGDVQGFLEKRAVPFVERGRDGSHGKGGMVWVEPFGDSNVFMSFTQTE